MLNEELSTAYCGPSDTYNNPPLVFADEVADPHPANAALPTPEGLEGGIHPIAIDLVEVFVGENVADLKDISRDWAHNGSNHGGSSEHTLTAEDIAMFYDHKQLVNKLGKAYSSQQGSVDGLLVDGSLLSEDVGSAEDFDDDNDEGEMNAEDDGEPADGEEEYGDDDNDDEYSDDEGYDDDEDYEGEDYDNAEEGDNVNNDWGRVPSARMKLVSMSQRNQWQAGNNQDEVEDEDEDYDEDEDEDYDEDEGEGEYERESLQREGYVDGYEGNYGDEVSHSVAEGSDGFSLREDCGREFLIHVEHSFDAELDDENGRDGGDGVPRTDDIGANQRTDGSTYDSSNQRPALGQQVVGSTDFSFLSMVASAVADGVTEVVDMTTALVTFGSKNDNLEESEVYAEVRALEPEEFSRPYEVVLEQPEVVPNGLTASTVLDVIVAADAVAVEQMMSSPVVVTDPETKVSDVDTINDVSFSELDELSNDAVLKQLVVIAPITTPYTQHTESVVAVMAGELKSLPVKSVADRSGLASVVPDKEIMSEQILPDVANTTIPDIGVSPSLLVGDILLSGSSAQLSDSGVSHTNDTLDPGAEMVDEDHKVSVETLDALIVCVGAPGIRHATTQETSIQEPATQEPVVQEPVVQEPVVQEPVVQEPVVQEPVVQEPVIQEAVVQEPVVQKPVVLETVAQELIVQEPAGTNLEYPRTSNIQERVIQEPFIQESIVQEPVVQEPVVHKPMVQEPVFHEPVVQELVVQEPVVHEPVVQELVVLEPVVLVSIVQESVVQELFYDGLGDRATASSVRTLFKSMDDSFTSSADSMDDEALAVAVDAITITAEDLDIGPVHTNQTQLAETDAYMYSSLPQPASAAGLPRRNNHLAGTKNSLYAVDRRLRTDSVGSAGSGSASSSSMWDKDNDSSVLSADSAGSGSGGLTSVSATPVVGTTPKSFRAQVPTQYSQSRLRKTVKSRASIAVEFSAREAAEFARHVTTNGVAEGSSQNSAEFGPGSQVTIFD
jgi:hypothetical protein